MATEQNFIERLKTLPPERQREVLEFVDFLTRKTESRHKEKTNTLLAHRGSVAVSHEQDFSAIRQEVIDEHVREENG